VKTLPAFFDTDVDTVLEFELTTLGDFDLNGAVGELHVTRFPNQPGGAEEGDPRPVTMYTNVASYSVVAGEFPAGRYSAQVRLTNGYVTVNSEVFRLVVDASV